MAPTRSTDPPDTETILSLEEVSQPGNTTLAWKGADPWKSTPEREIQYAWRLDGGEWSAFSHGTSHIFELLPSGKHTFQVKARDRNFNEDLTPASVTFTVVPPVWQEPWFIGMVIVFAGAVAAQTGRVIRRDRRLRESNVALSDANKELFGVNRELEEANRAMSDANKELFRVNQALQRDRAVERIRAEVQAMDRATDFERVLSLMSEDLKSVGLTFETFEIDVLDEPLDEPTMDYFREHGFRYTAYELDPDGSLEQESYHLSAPFPDVNLQMIERFIEGKPWQVLVGGADAIVEVPMSGYGRLRLTAKDRQEFSDDDIEALKEFAAAIALGYARYLDIREIQEQTQRKSAFLASMSHDLRTPMNAIKGFTNVVLRRGAERLSERHRDNLNKVIQAADVLLEMINDLMDLSKIEAGRMDVNPEPFDVKALVATCCATVSPLVSEKPDVALNYEVSEDVGEANTDQARVRRMVINLLSNAIKFTDAGSLTVNASKEGDQLVIAVADTGKGIPADEIDTIFDEYRQVKGSDKEGKGTGLGLSITKKFSELLGGSVSVESEVGKGSTFTV